MEKIPTEVTHWVGSVLLFIYKSKTENRFFFSVHSNFILLFTKVFVLFFFSPHLPSYSHLNLITSAQSSFCVLLLFLIKACPFTGPRRGQSSEMTSGMAPYITDAAASERERDTLLCGWLSLRLLEDTRLLLLPLLLPPLPLAGTSELLTGVPDCSKKS